MLHWHQETPLFKEFGTGREDVGDEGEETSVSYNRLLVSETLFFQAWAPLVLNSALGLPVGHGRSLNHPGAVRVEPGGLEVCVNPMSNLQAALDHTQSLAIPSSRSHILANVSATKGNHIGFKWSQ